MIGKASGRYDVDFSGYAETAERGVLAPGPSSSNLRLHVIYGFVELVGETSPRSIKGIAVGAAISDGDTEDQALIEDAQQDKAAGGGRKQAKARKRKKSTPIFEYQWSVAAEGDSKGWFWDLDNSDAIVVQVIFHTATSRYHVSEVAASLKQIPPYSKTKGQEILEWVEMLTPIADIAGKAMQAGGLTAPGKVVSTISRMKLNSVPAKQFAWFVKTFSVLGEPGIEWHIPSALINQTGNRLTGSVGVTFTDGAIPKESDSLTLEIKAFLREDHGEVFLSSTNTKVELTVRPI